MSEASNRPSVLPWGYVGNGWVLHAVRPKGKRTSFCGKQITSMLRYHAPIDRQCQKCRQGIDAL